MLDIKQVIDLVKAGDIAGAKELVTNDTDVQGSDAFKALVAMLAEAADTSDTTLLEKAQILASQVDAEFTHEDEGMARANTTAEDGGEEGSEHAQASDEEKEEAAASTEAPKEGSEHASDEEEVAQESCLGASLPTGPSALLLSTTSRATDEKPLAGDLPLTEDLSTAS